MIVLCYHKICDVKHDWNNIATSVDTFKKQLEYINDTIGFISIDEYEKNPENNKVLLTFDDGFEDNYFNVLPILEKMKIPALFFISTEKLEKREENWCNELVWLFWEGTQYPESMSLTLDKEKISYKTRTFEERFNTYRSIRKYMLGADIELRNKLLQEIKTYMEKNFPTERNTHYMLSKEQLIRLAQSKYVTIGCHTVSHRALALLSEKDQFAEINISKETLEYILERKIKYFAYPFGGIHDYNLQTIKILRDLGFCVAFSTTYKRWSEEQSKFEIPRVCINECDLNEFFEKIHKYQNKKSYWVKEERELA